MRSVVFGFLLFCSVVSSFAQDKKGIISGPMLGQVELRTAKIWLEVGKDARTVAVRYWVKGQKSPSYLKDMPLGTAPTTDFFPTQVEIGGLDFNTTYEYSIVYNNKETTYEGEFTTKDLWQWRKPAPDFSFLAGSCTYFNEPVFDRPGKPYGMDSSIFSTMATEKAAFMLWLGDNWYTREVDYSSEWGLWYRPSRERSMAVLQPFLKAMSHYATWDDHDFGPNDMGTSYHLKNTSREVFKNYWANPGYGDGEKGIYTKLAYSDVDFFPHR